MLVLKRELLQVLSPMRRGAAGVQNLNMRLQALLNPPQPERAEISLAAATDRPQLLRVGDRVIQAPLSSLHLRTGTATPGAQWRVPQMLQLGSLTSQSVNFGTTKGVDCQGQHLAQNPTSHPTFEVRGVQGKELAILSSSWRSMC